MVDKKEISVSFNVKVNFSKKMKLSDKDIQLLMDFKNGIVNSDDDKNSVSNILEDIKDGSMNYDPDTVKITDIVHTDKSKERKDSYSFVVPVREVDGKLLMYEQDLPKMTDEEYNKWFNSSELVDGVRMGPIINLELEIE